MAQVLINDGVTFEEVHADYFGKIKRWATQYVPGMTAEEVHIEIEHVLWRAWSTWDDVRGTSGGKGSFGGYFHLLWMHRKADIIEDFFKRKDRLPTDLVGGSEELNLLAQSYELADWPECPVDDPTTCKVWNLLAQGFLFVEIRRLLRLSEARFREIMQGLRTDPDVQLCLAIHPGHN